MAPRKVKSDYMTYCFFFVAAAKNKIGREHNATTRYYIDLLNAEKSLRLRVVPHRSEGAGALREHPSRLAALAPQDEVALF